MTTTDMTSAKSPASARDSTNVWSRRRLLGSSLIVGAAAGLTQVAAPLVRAFAAESADGDWSAEFAARLAANPMLLGWKSVAADRLAGTARIEGRLPPGLEGTLYRNGPAVHERFGLRYRHKFDGDGMAQAFRFGGGEVSHRARVLYTPKLAREDAEGRRVYPGFATTVDRGAPIRGPDDLNTANTSILDHHGELLALWEGGSASVLDRETLAWRGFKSWGEGLEGMPFTAHPKVDADGTVWAFGLSYFPAMRIVLYRIAPDGELVRAEVIDAGRLGMAHDFVVTERHLVIVIPPFVFEPEAARDGAAFVDAFAWRPELGSRVLVVSKEDFGERRWHQLPAGFGFHHGNGWEDAGGVIRYDHCIAADPTVVTERARFIMRGELRHASPERYSRFTLYPDGRAATVETTPGWAEFPRVAPAVTARRNRYVYTLGAREAEDDTWFHRVEKRDLEHGTVDTFDFGEGVMPEEHVFVPRPAPRYEDDGWLVGTFLAFEQGVTGVSVFDARRVGDGPVARGWLDYPLPLGLHGHFSPVRVLPGHPRGEPGSREPGPPATGGAGRRWPAGQ